MKHLDLFSGIGGFALAARWMGWTTVQFVEIDSFCHKVLSKNFPNVPIHDDIKIFRGTGLQGTIDIITGGFPCQPYSIAGERKGKEDDRHLWPEMLRVIGEVQPTYVVGENVYGLLNWSGGLVFDEVQSDLENLGYSVTPFVLPACGVNAPHKRDRVWFVAHTSGELWGQGANNGGRSTKEHIGTRRQIRNQSTSTVSGGHASDSYIKRVQRRTSSRNTEDEGTDSEQFFGRHYQPYDWRDFPTESPVRVGNDGLPANVVRCAIKATGNAIVPQVAFEIFKAIESTL